MAKRSEEHTSEHQSPRAERAGFELLETRRLPCAAWWRNFYDPLRTRMKDLEGSAFHEAVLRETEEEIAFFERYRDVYGYTFYVMRAGEERR